ncbi:MAG TPA: hypothetical protein VET48_10170, partial [Steroidobacteraceae bacterium]|nr:hypothetical protein [Steroidobacteraceae bacterium]
MISKTVTKSLKQLAVGACALGLAAIALQSGAATKNVSAKPWTANELSKALANSSRPQADRDRDADRKPAQLMSFFGVTKGMTAIDVIGLDGYLTEVLSVAVAPSGKVYLQ